VKSLLVLGLLTMLLTLGCLGDQSIAVVYRNDTGGNVTVYPYGRDYPKVALSVAAGGEEKSDLLVSDTQPKTHIARVEAVDAAGNLIYCHSFNYGELRQLGGKIQIRSGDNTC